MEVQVKLRSVTFVRSLKAEMNIAAGMQTLKPEETELHIIHPSY